MSRNIFTWALAVLLILPDSAGACFSYADYTEIHMRAYEILLFSVGFWLVAILFRIARTKRKLKLPILALAGVLALAYMVAGAGSGDCGISMLVISKVSIAVVFAYMLYEVIRFIVWETKRKSAT